jgi:hypothetical protein
MATFTFPFLLKFGNLLLKFQFVLVQEIFLASIHREYAGLAWFIAFYAIMRLLAWPSAGQVYSSVSR